MIVIKPYGYWEFVTWGLPFSVIRGKFADCVFPRENGFFLRKFFHRPPRSWRNDPITCTKTDATLFGPLYIVRWGFPYSILREKFGRNNFFAGKLVFFFKSLCFQQPPRCYGKDLITCTMTVIIPWGAWQNVSRGLLYSVRRKEISQICFSSGK